MTALHVVVIGLLALVFAGIWHGIALMDEIERLRDELSGLQETARSERLP